MESPTLAAQYAAIVHQRRADLRQYFANNLPVTPNFVWEIGCGHGHFLTAYAQAHPERLCLGIDLAKDRIARAVRKRDRAKLANLHFLQAEARVFLESLSPETTFGDIFVLFPDPWPKARHHKHRLLQTDFLRAISARAGQGARLFFRTDYRPYFDEVSQTLEGYPGWEVVKESWPFEFETVFQSRAEHYHSLVARPTGAGAISPTSPPGISG